MCEQGNKHVGWVNFDQINNAGMEGVDVQWRTTQFWREIICMEVVSLMSGAKGEEAHQEYNEEDGNHYGYVLFFIWLWFVNNLSSLKLFS